jgi:NhaP-type Na+/H+ and K+/H+ antiporter
MDKLFAMALAPFMAVGMLLIARPLSNWVKRKLPDSRLKRFLFISWR